MPTTAETLQGFNPQRNPMISPNPGTPGASPISGAPGGMSPEVAALLGINTPVTADSLAALTSPYVASDGLGITGEGPISGLDQVGLDLGQGTPNVGGSDLFKSLSSFGDLAQGAASIFGAYNAYKQLKLAKEQFGFTKDLTNRNLGNQAIVTNEALTSRRDARRAVAGGNAGPGPQVSGAPV